MEIIKINCFELNVANGGGRGSTTVGYAKTDAVASEWARQSQNWNTFRKLDKTFIIVESMGEWEQKKKLDLREQALRKLTKAEIEALGL